MPSRHRSSYLRSAFAVAFVLGGFSAAVGQEAARPDRGTMPNRSYSVSDIENINLQNGNVALSIPLAALPPIAGGKLSWTVSAHYNSKIWDVLRMQEEQPDLQWAPYVVDMPAAGGGWTIGGQYRIYFRDSQEDFTRVLYTENSGFPQWELDLLNNNTWWKVVLFMPDGSEHEFRPLGHASYWGSEDFLRGYFNVIPSGSPMRYYSVDGTYMFASISSMWDWTVYMPDGTQIIQTPDGIQRIQDTNGNKVKIFNDGNAAHYQDEQTGREIRVTYDPAANGGNGQNRVWYPTVGGTEHYIEVNYGTTTVQGKTYPVSDWDYGGEMVCQRTNALLTQLQIIREIIFPQTEPGQQRKFVFSYNSDTTENTTSVVNWSCNGYEDYMRSASVGWGELSRVIMPPGTTETSAYADYSYRLNSEHSLQFSTDDLAYQSITQKKLYHDGTYDTWGYSIFDNMSSFTGSDGNWLSELRYCSKYGQPNCSTDRAGLAFRTTRPFMMTERHWTKLLFSGGDHIGPGGVISFNPVVDFEYTTLLDANNNPLKMSAKAFQYDYNGNVTKTTEYDWFDPTGIPRDAQGVPTGVPGGATVLRVTNNAYYNQATGSTSGNVYAKRSLPGATPLILNAPRETSALPATAQFSYDGQAYDVAPTVGNLTSKSVWDDVDNKWITTSSTYGLYGNLATSIDARGKVTTFGYDNPALGLPTHVTVDPENGTGTQTTFTTYDYSTGLVTSSTDPNGKTSNIDYTNQLLGAIDPFGRPGVVIGPDIGSGVNHRTRTFYEDNARTVIVLSDLNSEGDGLLKSQTISDMLGRTIETRQYETASDFIAVRKSYDPPNRTAKTSNPFRAGEAVVWTTITTDLLGRVISVTTPDNAAVTTSYYGNFTTVTDQAGKVRRSMVDGLGRLIRVDEPDKNSGQLGSTAEPIQPTCYRYDVLGNLTKVIQGSQIDPVTGICALSGSQQRTFTYDSLSRLRTAVNPESGTISYNYDETGNLLVKTDARGVSSHYEYDGLNRVKRRWYNGSSSLTELAHNDPALPSGVGASDEAKYFYDSQSIPGAPTFDRGYSIGRLVATTYGGGSTGDYYGFDALGRAKLKIQQTGSINYQTSAAFNLAGAITSMSYPSGRTVTNSYDSAGRLTSFTGNLGDGGAPRTYASGLSYSSFGGMTEEQFGTNTPLYHKLHYNVRGQLHDIRVSTVAWQTDQWHWNRGAILNYYAAADLSCPTNDCRVNSGPDNNGNVIRQQHWVPANDAVTSYNYTEDRFTYDALNRLKSVAEYRGDQNGLGAQDFTQIYDYDRWGNRTIDQLNTWGPIPKPNFGVDASNNRLTAPAGYSMNYDAAGNLTFDSYTGQGARTYDAENRMTGAQASSPASYVYDGDGHRVKRIVNGMETWQVYGIGGELIAEYAANAPYTSPQKEYGYRNGELLITADVGAGPLQGGDPPTSGLVGHWKFDENAGTTAADSSGGNTGTLAAGAAWATGQSNSAVSLDGADDYVQVGAQSGLVMSTATSLSAWIYPTGAGSDGTYGGVIVNKEGEYEIARFADGTIQWAFANTNPGWDWISTGYVAPVNQWTHVAVTYDSGTIKTFINGTLTHTYNGSGAIGDYNTSLNDFRVGGRQGMSQNFQGRIDEVRVYNRALTASEVSTLTGGQSSQGLAGHWKFDENAGTTAADSSGSNNTGTLAAGAGWTSGQSGSGTNLDGADDYVQVGAQSGLVMSTATSLSAWIYPTGAGSDGTYGGVIVNKEGEYEIARFTDGTIQWAFANSNPGWDWISTGHVAPLNQWTHVAVTYDSGTVKTFINGTLTHTYNGSGAIGDYNTSLNDFRVGGRQGMSQNFQGRIDEVRVYNRALTASEVSALTGGQSSPGLAGHWKFDENAGATAADSSGSGHTGTLTAGAGWVTGQSNSAVSLDGADDYVQVGAQSGLVMSTATSLSAWIYPTGAGSDGTYGGIILNREGEYLIARFADGTIQWAFANSNPGWAFINTGYVAPVNQWTHVAVTYDSGTIKTFINGTLTHTYNGSGVIADYNTSLNDFRIGGRQCCSQNFQGRIDEVRVYNRALSASEVGTLSNGSGGGSSARIRWLVTDQLGTPRMIFDQTGDLTVLDQNGDYVRGVTRHDYLPFGEELFGGPPSQPGVGGRTTTMGYTSSDNVRQKFTQKERDNETGLDYFLARYYSSTQGRFASADPFDPNLERQSDSSEDGERRFRVYLQEPGRWNQYAYALNNPLAVVDPDGRQGQSLTKTATEIVESVSRGLSRFVRGTGAQGVAQIVAQTVMEKAFGPNIEVRGGGLRPHERAFAGQVAIFTGNSFIGLDKNRPGIDGILTAPGRSTDVKGAASLTETFRDNVRVLLDVSVDKERSATNAGYKNVDLFIKATNIDSKTALEYVQRGSGFTNITSGGTIRSINIFTNDNKVVRISGNTVNTCDTKGKCQ